MSVNILNPKSLTIGGDVVGRDKVGVYGTCETCRFWGGYGNPLPQRGECSRLSQNRQRPTPAPKLEFIGELPDGEEAIITSNIIVMTPHNFGCNRYQRRIV